MANPIPVEFLLGASRRSIQEYMITCLNRAALLRKRLREIDLERIDNERNAEVARLFLEGKIAIVGPGPRKAIPELDDGRKLANAAD